MTTVAIRKKLVNYMHIADDKKIKAVYTLLENDIKENGKISIEEYNKELDKGEEDFKKGNYITHTALKKKVKQW
jgi:hypothetical protein